MRNIALLALLFALAVAFDVQDILNYREGRRANRAKRQSTSQCTKIVCGAEGGSCPNEDLCYGSCYSNFVDCYDAATLPAQICQCYTTAMQCTLSKSPECAAIANSLREDCLSEQLQGCNCGTAAPLPAQSNECPFPLTACVNGTCTRRTTNGVCSGLDDVRCGDPNYGLTLGYNDYNCANSTANYQCTRSYRAYANDFCSSPSECFNGMACTGGRCQGKAAGVNCVGFGSCQFELYCANNATARVSLCAPRALLGANCSRTPCQLGLICGFGDICITPNSVANGARCVSDLECAEGSYCNGSFPTNNGFCTAKPARKICTEASECGDGLCECDASEGKKYCWYPVNYCVAESKKLDDCRTTNKCVGQLVAAGACVDRLCASELRCYISCLLNNDPDFSYAKGCFTANVTCGTATPTSAAISTPISAPTSAPISTPISTPGSTPGSRPATSAQKGTEGAAGQLFVGWILSAFLILALNR